MGGTEKKGPNDISKQAAARDRERGEMANVFARAETGLTLTAKANYIQRGKQIKRYTTYASVCQLSQFLSPTGHVCISKNRLPQAGCMPASYVLLYFAIHCLLSPAADISLSLSLRHK